MREHAIERVVSDEEAASEVAAMAMMLYSVPRDVQRVEAIAVLPGLGEHWRLQQAVAAWEESSNAKYLLVTGTNGAERTQVQPNVDFLRRPPVNLTRDEGVYTQVSAQHTKEQAAWLASKVVELDIKSLCLYVSPYHLLRGYCTVLKTFLQADIRVPIIPSPVTVAPATVIPETEVDAWDMVPGEVARIKAYQQKGDVATYAELRSYINWLWGNGLS